MFGKISEEIETQTNAVSTKDKFISNLVCSKHKNPRRQNYQIYGCHLEYYIQPILSLVAGSFRNFSTLIPIYLSIGVSK